MTRSATLSLRLDQQLAEVLGRTASEAGTTVSDFVRQAIEARVSSASQGGGPSRAINPHAVITAAARGSLAAQRALAKTLANMAREELSAHGRQMTLVEALVFARLAAAHGDVADQGLVLVLIAMRAKDAGEEPSAAETAEALARMASVADQQGQCSEQAAIAVLELAEAAAPEVVVAAQRIAAAMREAEAS